MTNSKRKKPFKKGDIIKVTANSGGANYTIGQNYRVILVNYDLLVCETLDGSWRGNNLFSKDCVPACLTIDSFKAENEGIKKEIENLKSQIKSNDDLIKWMTDMDIEEYDENEHRVFIALSAIDDKKLSKLEKAKLISGLIK